MTEGLPHGTRPPPAGAVVGQGKVLSRYLDSTYLRALSCCQPDLELWMRTWVDVDAALRSRPEWWFTMLRLLLS